MNKLKQKQVAWHIQAEKVSRWINIATGLAIFNLCTCLVSFATPSLVPNILFIIGFLCWGGIEVAIWRMNKKKKHLLAELMEEYENEHERSRVRV